MSLRIVPSLSIWSPQPTPKANWLIADETAGGWHVTSFCQPFFICSLNSATTTQFGPVHPCMNPFFRLPPDIWFIIAELLSLRDLSTLYEMLTSASTSTVTHVRTVSLIQATKLLYCYLNSGIISTHIGIKGNGIRVTQAEHRGPNGRKITRRPPRLHCYSTYIRPEDITPSFHPIPNSDNVRMTLSATNIERYTQTYLPRECGMEPAELVRVRIVLLPPPGTNDNEIIDLIYNNVGVYSGSSVEDTYRTPTLLDRLVTADLCLIGGFSHKFREPQRQLPKLCMDLWRIILGERIHVSALLRKKSRLRHPSPKQWSLCPSRLRMVSINFLKFSEAKSLATLSPL